MGTGGFNWGYFENQALEDTLNQASAEIDRTKRFELYAKAQKILVEESPALFIYEKNYRLPMRDNVKGFQFNGIYVETLNFYDMYKE
jgi:peptide/nickel transport system substrate-binding protein